VPRPAPFPLVLGCSRSLVGVDAESCEVVQETPHTLFFVPLHAVRALRTSRTLAVSYPPCAPQTPRTRSASRFVDVPAGVTQEEGHTG
ncbi:unnamed protein product, partial [Ascophyllum nodosum]